MTLQEQEQFRKEFTSIVQTKVGDKKHILSSAHDGVF
jgi:hypothetical protein